MASCPSLSQLEFLYLSPSLGKKNANMDLNAMLSRTMIDDRYLKSIAHVSSPHLSLIPAPRLESHYSNPQRTSLPFNFNPTLSTSPLVQPCHLPILYLLIPL
jgi:hypothetical protein